MVHLIKLFENVVYQKAEGGIAPLLQLRLTQEELENHERVREMERAAIRARVNGERADAMERGVHVVVDDRRPDNFVEVKVRQD
jgi:hypothetical protein